jgi:glycosyltransferase involved in cell wall biosynthesis
MSMDLNVIVSGINWYEPFVYCGLMFRKRFPCQISRFYVKGFTNILVYDLFWSVKWQKESEIAWLDTPLCMDRLIQPLKQGFIKPKFKRLYVTCEQNKAEAERIGLKVDGVIYRFVNPIAFEICSSEKKRDFSVIGAFYPYDRKNLRLINEVLSELNLYFEALTTAPFIAHKIRHGVLNDEAKFKWLSESRFLLHIPFSGSFEMPVLEAMACGVVPIYSEIPCLKEYAIGIPIKVGELSTVSTIDGVFYRYAIDKKDVIEAVKYALGLSRDAYEDLSLKAREKAREIDKLTYKKWIKVLMEFD